MDRLYPAVGSSKPPRKRTTSQCKSEPPLLRTSKRTIYTAGRPPWYNEHGTQSKEAFVIGRQKQPKFLRQHQHSPVGDLSWGFCFPHAPTTCSEIGGWLRPELLSLGESPRGYSQSFAGCLSCPEGFSLGCSRASSPLVTQAPREPCALLALPARLGVSGITSPSISLFSLCPQHQSSPPSPSWGLEEISGASSPSLWQVWEEAAPPGRPRWPR